MYTWWWSKNWTKQLRTSVAHLIVSRKPRSQPTCKRQSVASWRTLVIAERLFATSWLLCPCSDNKTKLHRDPATIQCIHSLTLRSHVARAERMTISKYLLKKGTKQKLRARSYFAQTAAAVVPRQSLLHPERRSCFWLLRLCLPHHDPSESKQFCTWQCRNRRFYTGTLLHTEAFTQRSFCTQKALYRETFAQRNFFTGAFRRAGFSHWQFYAQEPSNPEAFTQKSLGQRGFSTQKLLHIDTFPHRSL